MCIKTFILNQNFNTRSYQYNGVDKDSIKHSKVLLDPQDENNANSMEIFVAETAENIENLANATVQYKATNQNLTKTNTTITINLMEANHQLAEALNTIAALQVNGRYGEK